MVIAIPNLLFLLVLFLGVGLLTVLLTTFVLVKVLRRAAS